jgi:hypothetical protein
VSEEVYARLLHHAVIRLATVEGKQLRKLFQSHSCIQNEEGISSAAPATEAVLVIIELKVRANLLEQQV